MPDRYHIHTVPTPPRFRRIGKFGNIDWREDCSRCTNCVKLRCLYDVYRHEAAYNRDPAAPLDTWDECKACLSCVQGCTKGLLSVSVNPEFLDLGDEYWKPDILLTTWNQSDTGKIPVSGAGYRGRFHGPGFDSIWTDMSEIVRPTRDGIHGREYISTSVDIGPKPLRLRFTPDGRMLTPPSRLLEIQLPAILDMPSWQVEGGDLGKARAAAAQELKTLAVMPAAEATPEAHIVPLLGRDDIAQSHEILKAVRMVQIEDGPEVLELAGKALDVNPQVILSVRLPLGPAAAGRILDLAGERIKVFHLCTDLHGRERLANGRPGRHIKDALREVHGRLVKEGIRDEVTLIVAGGIALAEHMAKAIICGADLVAVDTALLVALGCRVCRHARGTGASCDSCPAEIGSADGEYAAQRIVNLMGAWHSQLIEVLGAMGIREVRRLRGEVGRAMFLEDIEKEAFGDLCRVSRQRVSA
ncbi:MAG TPA: glutamate synthase-related protein [Bryobacteraceae bacterium]|nr:glutamate synthase-related protein [Bryobacteraceae bacterium]